MRDYHDEIVSALSKAEVRPFDAKTRPFASSLRFRGGKVLKTLQFSDGRVSAAPV
ncbi:hypothetical protein GHK35_30635 [Sinorhizobium meliloti]|nr:hypothetical protein [Sinorhizobium meliloti]